MFAAAWCNASASLSGPQLSRLRVEAVMSNHVNELSRCIAVRNGSGELERGKIYTFSILFSYILIHSWWMGFFTKPLLKDRSQPPGFYCTRARPISQRSPMSLSPRTQLPSALHRPDASYHLWPSHCDLEGFCDTGTSSLQRAIHLSLCCSQLGHQLKSTFLSQGVTDFLMRATAKCCAVSFVRSVLLILSFGAQVSITWCLVPILHLQCLCLRTGLNCYCNGQ